MIVRYLDDDLEGTDRDVPAPTFHSRRFLLAKDGLNVSFHDTVLDAGTETRMWYANHVEIVYCIEGEGELEDLDNEETYEVRPGMMYCLDNHEHHVLRARTDLRMICVFDPPLTGDETHDDEGVYPMLLDPDDPRRRRPLRVETRPDGPGKPPGSVREGAT